jgi:hypothetical protein
LNDGVLKQFTLGKIEWIVSEKNNRVVSGLGVSATSNGYTYDAHVPQVRHFPFPLDTDVVFACDRPFLCSFLGNG